MDHKYDAETGEIVHTEAADVVAVQAPPPALVPLASASVREVCTALAIAQGEFRTPKRTKEASVQGTTKDGKPYNYKYMYAPLEEIVDAVKDGLAKNGLSRQQYLVARGNQTVLRTIIWHASGEWIASDYPVHVSKDGAQGFAGGVTYARRYGLSLALGIAPEDDDDANFADGNAPAEAERAGPARAAPARKAAPPPSVEKPVKPVIDKEQLRVRLKTMQQAIDDAGAVALNSIMESDDIRSLFNDLRETLGEPQGGAIVDNLLTRIEKRRKAVAPHTDEKPVEL